MRAKNAEAAAQSSLNIGKVTVVDVFPTRKQLHYDPDHL